MKPISCMYITGGLVAVLVISLYFAYKKKQEEIQELARARAEAVAKTKEHFRGYGGVALRNGGGGTAGGSAAGSVFPVENF